MEARQVYTRCKKPSCSTCADKPSHGPYWYGFGYVENEAGQARKRVKFAYFGREEPSERKIREAWAEYIAGGGGKAKAKAKAKAGGKSKSEARSEARSEAPRSEARSEARSDDRFTYSRMGRAVALRILGLDDGYTRDAMRSAVRELIKLYHPDKKKPSQREHFTQIMSAINAAADFLGRGAADTGRGKRN